MAAAATWIAALRPKTLAAGAVPVAVGTLLARPPGEVAWGPAGLALAGALLLQIGCNFANELGDAARGADTPDRLGPTRAVAAGLIAPAAMRAAMLAVFALAILVGLALALHAGWPILAIGAVSVAAALAYTMGPYPLAYRGLGEPFVLLFFGLVATLGAAWVQVAPLAERLAPALAMADRLGEALARIVGQEPDLGDVLARQAERAWALLPWWTTALAIGVQACVLITVNNLRDLATDAPAGKRTIAVRLGEARTRVLLVAMLAAAPALWALAAAVALPGPARALGLAEPGWLPAVVAAVAGIGLALLLRRARGAALNRVLALAGAALLATGIAACASLWR